MEEQIETRNLTNEQLATLTKYAGLEADMDAKLMIGFWFGIGVISAVS